ncbi:MAG: methylated-DNA--[Muribaculaceae bacterium]|nr:methylated-DNA--[protein]-cysteine S-methyltransferase [Muribaculaceae bacterium]
MDINLDNIRAGVDLPILHMVGEVADDKGRECYVVGGYVRDLLLRRPSDDMDFVTVGSGIELAQAVAARLGRKRCSLAVYRNYGTAQVRSGKWELEFVGARRESYRRESRNPIVEDGTLDDDQRRRDFTINAMAVSLNSHNYGTLLDPFDGVGDLKRRVIRTPLDPDITFSDDPLRMLRAVRFATQLQFDIHPDTLDALARNAKRIEIITVERVTVELNKIMLSPEPSRGFLLLDRTGLLQLIFPELAALKGVDNSHGRGHKDNFLHTLQVLDNVAAKSDSLWLRWAALLHDIGKPASKRWDPKDGWTFHNHNFIGEKMVPAIFKRFKLPLAEPLRYVKKLVGLHMRPIALVEDEVTDSAVRRLLFEAGDDIDDLMTLCTADITSRNREKVQRFRENFQLVRQKLVDIEQKDRIRNFQPPVDGDEIMMTFGLKPCREVGLIKDVIKDAILDGVIGNNYAQAYAMMMSRAGELGITAVAAGELRYIIINTPAGEMTLAATTAGLALSLFGNRLDDVTALANRLALKSVAQTSVLLQRAAAQLQEYFAGKRREFDLPLDPHGTEFQLAAWRFLRSIPSGQTRSYSEQAEAIGNADAARAVAQADGANPLCVIVPCHRVINSDGSIGGYTAPIAVKQQLLALEAAN